jgi:hypothetical protein
MLGPVQWYRWQCFQDAVYFKVLGAQRTIHDDMRAKYAGRKRTHDLSARSPLGAGDDFFFDFVADTGDSFNGTYSINSLLASTVCGLPSPSLLLHGGDLSYPWPQRHEMWNRFVLPLEYSRPMPTWRPPPPNARPSMFLVPGNHEWDDGLTTFDSLIIDELDTIGQYNVPQQSSCGPPLSVMLGLLRPLTQCFFRAQVLRAQAAARLVGVRGGLHRHRRGGQGHRRRAVRG